jgi:hypothetical protein
VKGKRDWPLILGCALIVFGAVAAFLAGRYIP